MIGRPSLLKTVRDGLKSNPVVALLGPRQCGKTTLARSLARSGTPYFDLENPADLARLAEPMLALGRLRGLVVIDEVQRRPDLFPVLRVLSDRRPAPARFLVLGSASPELLRQTSETLAGRVRFVEMGGFSLDETGAQNWRRLWVRGGFPRSYLARSEAESTRWREDFVQTFLERDLPQLGMRVPAATLRRFWVMLAHYAGGIWNGSEIGRSLGEAHTTVRRHLDLLDSALVVRVLAPWHENVGKRQVKAPKVYVRDTGLLHALLGVPGLAALESHPKLGASWESFAIEQVLQRVGAREAYHWRTQAGAELDLLLFLGGKRIGVEVKYGDAPALTRSMASALADLRLDRLFVAYAGTARFPLGKKIEALPLQDCLQELTKLARRR
ncbi:MAG: ATP-binding protein [Burkholderiales bacterium]